MKTVKAKVFAGLLFFGSLISCEQVSNYPGQYWEPQNPGCRYGNCNQYPYGNYDYRPPYGNNNYPYQYEKPYYNKDYHHHHYHNDHDYKPKYQPLPPVVQPTPVPQPAETIIRPNCPPDTHFDGRHCIINDRSKIRPGGKGTVNACPKDMWLSGDRCVRH